MNPLKKLKWSRTLAAILIGVMVLQTPMESCVVMANAETVEGEEAAAAVETGETFTVTDEIIAETPEEIADEGTAEISGQEDAENLSEDLETAEAEDGSVTENETDSKETETDDAALNDAAETSEASTGNEGEQQEINLDLNYVYIENMAVGADETERILVSVGTEDAQLSGAQLTIVNTQTNESTQLEADSLTDGAAAFSWAGSAAGSGIYQVTALHYQVASGSAQSVSGTIDLTTIDGVDDICFAVGQESPFSESDFTQAAYTQEELAEDLEAAASGYEAADSAGYSAESGVSDELTADQTTDAAGIYDTNIVTAGTSDQETVQALSDALQKAKSAALSGQELDADQASGSQSGASLRASSGSYVIVLDPGHDATHAGARANGLNEEELTLKVATYCKEYLEANYTNVVVYMTRSSEACPYPGTTSGDDNAARVAAAAKVGADAYIAIHMDTTGTGTTTASGAAVWYPNSNYNGTVASQGSVLASKIVAQLVSAGMNNRGIKIRNSENNTTYADGSLADYYQIIRLSKEYGFPGVIVEHAFLNNASDAAFLKSEDNLKKLGIADALGIAEAYSLSTEEVEYSADTLTVSNVDGVNGSFDITLTGAAPTDRIAKVCFKVYPTANSAKSYLYTAEDKGNGTYTITANVSNHGNLTGNYKIIAYAYDAAGKKTQLRSTTATIDEAALNTDTMTLLCKPTSNEKKVTLTLKGNSGAADVYFKVYNKEKGAKTAKKVAATKQKNGNWKATISIADYKAAGDYVVTAYSTSYFGTTTKVKTGSFTIEGPTAKKVAVYKLNLTKGTFQLRVSGLTSKSGVKKISMTVQTLDGKKIKKTYTPKKKGSYYYVNVDMKDFQYQFGRYRVTVSVTDGNQIQKTVLKSTQEIEQPEPEITAKLKSKETKISVKAEDLGIGANIKGVRFTVYNTAKTSKKKNYDAKKASDGSYSASINVSDFGLSGKYKIVTYIKNASGKYVKTGETQTVTVADITGGTVTTKRKSDSSSYLFLSSVSCNTTISKVEVKAWPDGKSNKKYTYKATLRSNGSYRVLIDSKNHGGTGGTYRYQIIVTGKNGVQKTLLKGKLELGESEDTGGKYAISGTSQVTVAQMVAYYKKNATYPSYYADSDAPTITKFCKIYYDECQKEGIRVEVAFAQAMKETGFLRFGGDVDISQYNFAGIGATGGGEKGNSFPTVRTGIRAQIQHLKAYANSEPLVQAQVDPRFQYVTRGSAPYVEWLGIPDNPTGKGWATAQNYGSSILQMIRAIKSC